MAIPSRAARNHGRRQRDFQSRKFVPLKEPSALGIALAIAVIFCGVLLYPATQGPLILDDFPNLQVLEQVRSLPKLAQLKALMTEQSEQVIQRPLAIASFVLHNDPQGLDVHEAKLFNLAIHLLNGLLLVALLALVCQKVGLRMPVSCAIFVMIVFLLHPINLGPIYLTVQRMTSLATTVMLVALLTGASAISQGQIRLFRLSFAVLVFPAIGFFIKQNSVLAISYLGLLVWLILPAHPRIKLASAWLTLLPAALILIKFVQADGFASTYAERPFSLDERLLSQPRALLGYLSAMIWPWGHDFSVYQDDFAKSTGWLSPLTTLPSLIAIAGLAGTAWVTRYRYPAQAFIVAAFLSGHVIESTVVPLELVFEHRNYSASAIMLLGAGIWLCKAWSSDRFPRRAVPVLLVLMLGLANVAYVQAQNWSSQTAIQHYALVSKPNSARANIEISLGLHANDEIDAAIRHARRAAELAPYSLGAYGQFLMMKWLYRTPDPKDLSWIRENSDWSCRDPLAISLVRSASAAPDVQFRRIAPIIRAVLEVRLSKMNCEYKRHESMFRLASLSARLGDVTSYLAGMGALIAELKRPADITYYCGQLYYVGMRRLPPACGQYLEAIIERYSEEPGVEVGRSGLGAAAR